MNTNNINSQISASIVKLINTIREDQLEEILEIISANEKTAISAQSKNLADALLSMKEVENFIADPDHILGQMSTKHGEIFERLEVAINNAESKLQGGNTVATADPAVVGRTANAPIDYLLNGKAVQAKCINGDLNTLKHITEHLKKYEDIGFAQNNDSFYHIPKDTYDHLIKILENGELDGRHSRSIRAITDQIKEIENISGQKFTDIVKPAHAAYADVQLDRIQETIDRYKNDLSSQNADIKQEIIDNGNNNRAFATISHQPSVFEGLQTAGYAAAISASIGFAFAIYKKHTEGKSLLDFDENDWNDVLIASGKNAIKGAVSGGAIYALTNCAGMAAPVAGAIISASFGVISLVNSYRLGELTMEELVVEAEIVCIEAAIIAAGAAAGQFAIPVPVLGAVVGTLATTLLIELLEYLYGDEIRDVLDFINHKIYDTSIKIYEKSIPVLDEIAYNIAQCGGILAMICDDGLEVNIRYALDVAGTPQKSSIIVEKEAFERQSNVSEKQQ